MSYPFDWNTVRENGLAVSSSPVSPISGLQSLLMYSNGTEWDVTDPGLRKSANVSINPVFRERGFSDGRLRTFLRRNNVTSQSRAWGGIYIVSDQDGIGTRLNPGQNRYEISDHDGLINLVKFTDALPETPITTLSLINPNVVYGLEVVWNYDALLVEMNIHVSIGTALDFSDLTPILAFTDSDSPHHVSVSEGLFVQTLSTTDVVSYTFDTTYIWKSAHI